MSFRNRFVYVVVLTAVVSATVVLVLSIGEGFGGASGVDRLLENPAYWVIVLGLAWMLAPFLSKKLPLKRWWQ
jgi:hypothetical protein